LSAVTTSALDAVRVYPLSDRGVHATPLARAAFFATRLSPAPVLRIVRFADFTTFVVLDFLRLAILFPPVRYLVGPSSRPLSVRTNPHHHGFGFDIWKLSRNGTGLVRLLSPVLRVVEMTASHRHTHSAPRCNATCTCCNLFRLLPARLPGRSAAREAARGLSQRRHCVRYFEG
jgi:hypothetical protein